MRVAPKVGNLRSEFAHARPSGSGVIRYVRDGRTDGQTDGQKQSLLPLPYERGIISYNAARLAQSLYIEMAY